MWYVIDGDEHLRITNFKDALTTLKARWENNKATQQLSMMSAKEYAEWHGRKRKRGKHS
jgi:hypothetical protein